MEAVTETMNNVEVQELVITRVLEAPRELVFKVWTEQEHLVHWWGPKGMNLGVSKLECYPGGMFHYSIAAPNGLNMWGRFIYLDILAPQQIVYISSFSDEEGQLTRAPFSSTWPLEVHNVLTLTEQNGTTLLTQRSVPINATDEEQKTFLDMHRSLEQGFNGTFEQLEAYLTEITLD
ncbi:SRPBCC domain-containing protein [Telluribacter sp. SYSU D00476]|uniref:SRPBCC family protein n=1 Tax=Telluribacter sp. SYSU D00476 TaxID=2811430 RepID=UPI001FF4949F|nr:SRPBCC domain-containing protein [Telluribacter sp. SYSU D00476]